MKTHTFRDLKRFFVLWKVVSSHTKQSLVMTKSSALPTSASCSCLTLVISMVLRFRWFPNRAHPAHLAHQEFLGPLDPRWVLTVYFYISPGCLLTFVICTCSCQALTAHNVFQGLHGMPGPKVRLRDRVSSTVCMWRRQWHVSFGTKCPCVLMQGEPGAGMRGEKGETGAPGFRVSDTRPLLSYCKKKH